MNKKQQKKTSFFPKDQLRAWEDSDGVNYAIALARITGWLLHVDWLRNSDTEEHPQKMKSLRVYVGDNADRIYDVSGNYRVASFMNNIVLPLRKKRGNPSGGILNVFYSEEKILQMPLRVLPDLKRVFHAETLMRSNDEFLKTVTIRKAPYVPAYQAAKFTFGYCAIFSTALKDILSIPSTAIIALKYNKLFAVSKLGYVHSFNIHSDGKAEDVWGIQTVEQIVARFGIDEYILSESDHTIVNEGLKKNSPEKYQQIYDEAICIIRKYSNAESN